jgi:hypothetical protein
MWDQVRACVGGSTTWGEEDQNFGERWQGQSESEISGGVGKAEKGDIIALYSKMANPVTRWLPSFMSAILWFKEFTPPSKTACHQHHGGYPKKLTTCDQHLLARKVTSGVADTAPQLKKLLDLDISTQTVRNALKRQVLSQL